MNLWCAGAILENEVLQMCGVALVVRAKADLNSDVIQTSRIVIRESFPAVDTVVYPRRG